MKPASRGPAARCQTSIDALLAPPPFPWLRPPRSRICGGSRGRDTRQVLFPASLAASWEEDAGEKWRQTNHIEQMFGCQASLLGLTIFLICRGPSRSAMVLLDATQSAKRPPVSPAHRR